MNNVCVVEFTSIAKGIKSLDMFSKNVIVDIYRAGVTCPGKYYYVLVGEIGSLEDGFKKVDSDKKELISGVNVDVLKAIKGHRNKKVEDALGIIEIYGIGEGIRSLDKIVKEVGIKVLKIVLGYGTAGKCYYVVTGSVDEVKESVTIVEKNYKVKNIGIINNPIKEIEQYI